MNPNDFDERLRLLKSTAQVICGSGPDAGQLDELIRTFAILAGALSYYAKRPEPLTYIIDAVRAGYESAPRGDSAFQAFMRQVKES